MTTRWMGKFTAALTASLLTACQLGPGAVGALSFSFQAPARSGMSFQIQAIPAGTSRFEVLISGEGLETTLTETIDVAAGSQARTIREIPVGPKQVQVRALAGSEVLASASTDVLIEAGKTAQAQLDLSALRALVGAKLEQSLPLDVNVRLRISGAGLDSPVEKSFSLAAGSTDAAMGTLPLGSKQVQVNMTAGSGAQTVASRELNMTFSVSADGGTLLIPAGVVLKAFEDDLEPLLQRANPLVLLGWIQQLKSDPVRLREFFFLLPPGARERLRANPLVSGSLPAEPDTPTGSPSPAATAVPVAESRMDLRLALVQPENPVQLMLSPPRNIPGQIVVLSNSVVPVNAQSAWGMLIRTDFSGSGTVAYTIRLSRDDIATGAPVELLSRNGSLRQKVNLDGRSVTGDLVAFAEGAAYKLEPSSYTLDIALTEPESGLNQSARFLLQVG